MTDADFLAVPDSVPGWADWLKDRGEWTWERILSAVVKHTESDGPRLLAALWLDERGDPRGEFVRVQVELTSLPDTHPGSPSGHCELCVRADALRRRGRELLTAHGFGWFRADLSVPRHIRVLWDFDGGGEFKTADVGRDFPLLTATYRRGFVEHVALDWPTCDAHLDALRLATPLRTVRLTTWPEVWYWYGDDGASGSYTLSLTPLTPGVPDSGRAERPDRFGAGAVATLLQGRWPGIEFGLPQTLPWMNRPVRMVMRIGDGEPIPVESLEVAPHMSSPADIPGLPPLPATTARDLRRAEEGRHIRQALGAEPQRRPRRTRRR